MCTGFPSSQQFLCIKFRCLSAGLIKGLKASMFLCSRSICTHQKLLMSAAPCLINYYDITQSIGNAVYSNDYIMEMCCVL